MLKFKPQFFFLLSFLIYLAFFYLIESYLVYICILVLISIIYFILYFATSLYMLHNYSVKVEKGEKISIPKTLPDFVINLLKYIKLFSDIDAGIKEIKWECYLHIVLYSILALPWILYIYLA